MNRVFLIGRDPVPQLTRLNGGERLFWTFVVLPGVSCSLSVEIDLEGPSCEVDIAGLYLCKSDEDVKIDILVRHSSGGCVSRQLFKGIVGGAAKASFEGLIYVAGDAQKTKAYQESHTILLSADALVQARPQLEIYADDVECSHGATSGYLNEDELFYMRSRGIPEEQARRMQMESFISPVLSRLSEDICELTLKSI